MAKIETSICVSDWISFPLAALNGAIAFFLGVYAFWYGLDHSKNHHFQQRNPSLMGHYP